VSGESATVDLVKPKERKCELYVLFCSALSLELAVAICSG
jgi:hypothetical protein